jgi:hypothetical protein
MKGKAQYRLTPNEGSLFRGFVKKVRNVFNVKSSSSKLVSTRRLPILSLPLH